MGHPSDTSERAKALLSVFTNQQLQIISDFIRANGDDAVRQVIEYRDSYGVRPPLMSIVEAPARALDADKIRQLLGTLWLLVADATMATWTAEKYALLLQRTLGVPAEEAGAIGKEVISSTASLKSYYFQVISKIADLPYLPGLQPMILASKLGVAAAKKLAARAEADGARANLFDFIKLGGKLQDLDLQANLGMKGAQIRMMAEGPSAAQKKLYLESGDPGFEEGQWGEIIGMALKALKTIIPALISAKGKTEGQGDPWSQPEGINTLRNALQDAMEVLVQGSHPYAGFVGGGEQGGWLSKVGNWLKNRAKDALSVATSAAALPFNLVAKGVGALKSLGGKKAPKALPRRPQPAGALPAAPQTAYAQAGYQQQPPMYDPQGQYGPYGPYPGPYPDQYGGAPYPGAPGYDPYAQGGYGYDPYGYGGYGGYGYGGPIDVNAMMDMGDPLLDELRRRFDASVEAGDITEFVNAKAQADGDGNYSTP